MPLDLSKFTQAKSSAPKLDLTKFTKSTPIEDEEVGDLRKYSAMALRGVAGFAPPGWIGAGASGLAEIGAQKLEGEEDINWPEVGVQAGLGAIPLGNTVKIVKAIGKGALMSSTGTAMSQQTKKGLHLPNEEEIKEIGTAGLIGGGTAGLLHGAGKGITKLREAKTSKVPAYVIKEPKVILDDNILKTANGKVEEVLPVGLGKESRRNPPRPQSAASKAFTSKLEKSTANDTQKATLPKDVIPVKKPKYKSIGGKMTLIPEPVIKSGIDQSIIENADGTFTDTATGEVVTPKVTLPEEPKVTIPGQSWTNYSLSKANGTPNPPISPVGDSGIPPNIPPSDELVMPTSGSGKDGINPLRKLTSEGRQIQTSFDLSFPFRQGIANIHKGSFWKAFPPMFKAAWSEGNFEKIEQEIKNDPQFDLFHKAGMEFTGLSDDIAHREEQLRGTWSEKIIPGIKASNRAYTTFANKLRLDLAKNLSKDAEGAGAALMETKLVKGKLVDVPTTESKAIAKFVNAATGRGDLGTLEKNAVLLNDLFFSPKLIASRVNMFARALDASNLAFGRKGMMGDVHPAVAAQLRKEALKSMASIGSLAATSIGISKMAGAEGVEDPRNTDFGKIKIGNTRFDFTGGFQPYMRVAAQFASGKADIEGELQKRKRADTIGRFAWAKASPLAGLIIDFAMEKDVVGNKFDSSSKEDWTREVGTRMLPLLTQDIYNIWMEDPKLLVPATAASMFGVSVQSYGKRKNSGSGRINLKPRMFKAPRRP